MNKKQLAKVMKDRKLNTLLRKINGVRLALGYSKALFTEQDLIDIAKELKGQEWIETGLFRFERFGKDKIRIRSKFSFTYSKEKTK